MRVNLTYNEWEALIDQEVWISISGDASVYKISRLMRDDIKQFKNEAGVYINMQGRGWLHSSIVYVHE